MKLAFRCQRRRLAFAFAVSTITMLMTACAAANTTVADQHALKGSDSSIDRTLSPGDSNSATERHRSGAKCAASSLESPTLLATQAAAPDWSPDCTKILYDGTG